MSQRSAPKKAGTANGRGSKSTKPATFDEYFTARTERAPENAVDANRRKSLPKMPSEFDQLFTERKEPEPENATTTNRRKSASSKPPHFDGYFYERTEPAPENDDTTIRRRIVTQKQSDFDLRFVAQTEPQLAPDAASRTEQATRRNVESSPVSRRSSQLPTPTTREFEVGHEMNRKTDPSPEQPLRFFHRQHQRDYPDVARRASHRSAARNMSTSSGRLNQSVRDISKFARPANIEEASMGLAESLLARTHDDEVSHLGRRIYKSARKMQNATIIDAVFDPDTDDSEYSEDLEVVPPSPTFRRMEKWWELSRLLRTWSLMLLVALLYCFFTGYERHIIAWLTLAVVVLIIWSVMALGMAALQKRERDGFGKVLRSGLLYTRNEEPRPVFRSLSE